MDYWDVFMGVVTFLIGLGVVLYGVQLVGEALEKSTGVKFRNSVAKLTGNRFGAVAAGLGMTVALGSSSAAMGMFVALSNAKVIKLIQALTIVLGVNIGTAIVHQLAGVGSIPILKILSLAIVAGAFIIVFNKKQSVRNIAKLIISIGLLLFGISIIADGMSTLNNDHVFDGLITSLADPANPANAVLIILLFFGITCVLQTSLSTFIILVSFIGILPVDLATFAALGINLGTAVASMLFTIGSSVTAKRMGIMHVLFNIIGTCLFAVFLAFVPFGSWFGGLIGSPVYGVLLFDLFYKTVMAFLLLPFIKYFAKFTAIIFKDKTSNTIDDNKLMQKELVPVNAVPVALQNTTMIYERLVSGFFKSIDYLNNKSPTEYSFVANECDNIEKETVFLEKTIIKNMSLVSAGDQERLSKILDVVHKDRTIIRKTQKILFFTDRWQKEKDTISAEQLDNIKQMCDNILIISLKTLAALKNFDSTDKFDKQEHIVSVLELDMEVDKIKQKSREFEVAHYKNEEMTAALATYSTLINAIDDISEAFVAIALVVL